MFLLVLTLLSLLYLGTECSILPVPIVQAAGLDATFLCQSPALNDGPIEWQINGTCTHNLNVGEGLIRREGRGEGTEALIISALPQFNGTSIVCIVYIIEPNGTVTFIDSTPAMLIVQGSLEPVINLTTTSTSSAIHLAWKSPFPLNLTTAEPDIVYCVDVFNITDENTERYHLISNCSVFETYYNFEVDNPDTFQFIITPRSNVEGARNGTAREINAAYLIEKIILVSSLSVTTTRCCFITNSQLLSTQLSTIQGRTDPTSDPTVTPRQLLLLMLPAIIIFILVILITVIITFAAMKLKKAGCKQDGGQSEGIFRKRKR